MNNIDILTREDLQILAERHESPCVSMFMPTHRMSKETRQDPIRFKNLVGKAEEELLAMGIRRVDAGKILGPARKLLVDDPFWQHQGEGLAVFLTNGGFRTLRLPVGFEELVVVTNRFHIKPLLSLFSGDGRFYVLALSQNEVRMFQCTQHTVNEVKVAGLPANRAEALKYDNPERQLQFHTGTSGVKAAGGGRRPAVFHGQGTGIDDEKDAIMRYFLQIERGLQKVLSNERAPLVLAAVDYLFSIYREVNTYHNLLERGITGNPETLRAEELHAQAWKIVRPHFQEAKENAAARYRQSLGTGLASNDYKEIIASARNGRVEVLFVTLGMQLWGTFNPDDSKLELHRRERPGDEDLLDFAAFQTVLNGGEVYAVAPEEVPDEAPMAALFRY